MKNSKNKTEEKTLGFSEVMSMLESMNDGIKIISEQHGGIVSRLDKIDVRLDGMDAKFDIMDKKIDRLQDDMVEVKYELKRKVDVQQFEKLEKRVVKLEKLSFSHQA